MKRKTTAAALAAALTASAASLLAAPAFAVTNPYDTFDGTTAATSSPATSYVGVGSDTTQIVMHQLVEAYNATNPTNKLSSFSAEGTPASIFLKTSSSAAIARPNGSGAGKALLFAPNNNPEVDFARSSGTLTSAEISGNLLQSAFAVDGLKMAVSKAVISNAPASLTPAQIVAIYKGTADSWDDVGGTSTATIKPYIPQSGSGTRKFFEAKLKEANGNQAVQLASAVHDTQEHSPTDIANDPNAIAPFSTARAAGLTTQVKLEDGTNWNRAVYNVFRSADASKFVSVFGPTGYLCGTAGKTVIEAAGFKQLAPTTRHGKCGVFTTDEVTNLKTSDQDDSKDTTTTLTGTPANAAGGNVALKSTIAGTNTAGSVEFREGATSLGTVAVNAGKADLNLSNVALGAHDYKALFTPSNLAVANASESDKITVTVKKPSTATLALTPATQVYAHGVQATATVTSDGGPATGDVQFKLGTTVLKTGTLVNGAVTVTLAKSLTVGTKSIVASYLGTADTYKVDSPAKSVVITKASSRTTTSKTSYSVKYPAKGKIAVTVKIKGGVSGINPSGTVTIKNGSSNVGKGTLSSGKVTVTLSKLPVKTYTLKAHYDGSKNVGTSTSASFTLKVTR